MLKQLQLTIRWLSLDVVGGGVIFTLAIAKVAGVVLPWSIPIALACCIWLIYTLDHLIDAHHLGKNPSMARHAFHKKYRREIFIAFLLVALFGLRVLFFLPYDTLVLGCVLLGLVGIYFLFIGLFKLYFAKEIFIAILYACGIFLGSYSLSDQLDPIIYLLFIQTALMASINLLLFSYHERGHDIRDGHRSWATHFGPVLTRMHLSWMFRALFCSMGITFYYQITDYQLAIQGLFLGMASVLGMIYLQSVWFEKDERFRWVGDLVFFFPGLVYLL